MVSSKSLSGPCEDSRLSPTSPHVQCANREGGIWGWLKSHGTLIFLYWLTDQQQPTTGGNDEHRVEHCIFRMALCFYPITMSTITDGCALCSFVYTKMDKTWDLLQSIRCSQTLLRSVLYLVYGFINNTHANKYTHTLLSKDRRVCCKWVYAHFDTLTNVLITRTQTPTHWGHVHVYRRVWVRELCDKIVCVSVR